MIVASTVLAAVFDATSRSEVRATAEPPPILDTTISAEPCWLSCRKPKVDISEFLRTASVPEPPVSTLIALWSVDVSDRYPAESTLATTPCCELFKLMAFTREPSESLSKTSKDPMVTSFILKPVLVVPEAILRAVVDLTVAEALIPSSPLLIFIASANAPIPFVALLLYWRSTDSIRKS